MTRGRFFKIFKKYFHEALDKKLISALNYSLNKHNNDNKIIFKTQKEKQSVHIYLFGRRWHVGPNPLSKICWLFSAKTEKCCSEYVRWFEPIRQAAGNDKWVRNRSVTISTVQ